VRSLRTFACNTLLTRGVPVEHRDADGAVRTVSVYNKIVALRPDWHSDDPDAGRIKVVMTGSASDPAAFQPHLNPKDVRKRLKLRAKNPTIAGDRHRPRHVAHRFRRPRHAHDVRRQAHAGGAGLMQAISRGSTAPFATSPAG